MKRILYTLTALSLFSMSAVAQSSGGAADPHFSQFYGAPLTLNPAMTGAFDCNYRITAIYRTQWGSVLKEDAVPMFSTPALGIDFRANVGRSGALGAGISALSDRAGQSKFMTNRVGLSLAYHQSLDRRREHSIGLGLQVDVWQRSISYDGLQFPLQNNNGSFDGSLPNGEYLVNNNFLSVDFHVGGLYTGRFGRSGRSSGYLGFAAHHVTRPTESFLGDKSVRVPMKFTFHGGFRFKIKGRFDAQPKFIYMNQGVSHELNIGNDFRFIFEERDPEGNNFRFGAMFRMVGGDNKAAWKDKVLNPEAVILNAAIEFSKITVGVAYDINVSQLVNASKTFGAFEIHAGYIGCFPRTRPQTIFCPKF